VEKVIDLLTELQKSTEEQGKVEAAAYDKYACFCKEQADEKLYMIEKSEKKIAKLDAKIEELEADITELSAAISDLATKIEKLHSEIEEAQAARNKEHAAYKVADKDTSDAIAAMEGAIKALKASKGAMDAGAKVDLAQVKNVASRVLAAAGKSEHMAVASAQLTKVTAFLQQSPPAYEYRSNDIIQTLEELKDTFLENKKEDDEEEHRVKSAWAKKDLNLKNVKKFSEEEKAQKEQFVEAKSEEKQKNEEDRTAETKDKDADKEFLDLLTEECQGKASQWDQRSSTRVGELTAIADALTSLKESVAGAYSANKKLSGVQMKSAINKVVLKGHWAWVDDAPGAKKKRRQQCFCKCEELALSSLLQMLCRRQQCSWPMLPAISKALCCRLPLFVRLQVQTIL